MKKINKLTTQIPQGRVELDLNPDITILIGVNGSGKTLTLKALVKYARQQGLKVAYDRQWPAMSMNYSEQSITKARELGLMEDNRDVGQLSTGQQRLLAIIKLCLEDGVDMIVLDCPETHLHIEVQDKLINSIRSICPEAQIVVASHSPALAMNGWLCALVEMQQILTK